MDILRYLDPVKAHIIDAVHIGRHILRAALCRQPALHGGVDRSPDEADAFLMQPLHGLETLRRTRDLDQCGLPQLLDDAVCFLHHGLRLLGSGLHEQLALLPDDGADLL